MSGLPVRADERRVVLVVSPVAWDRMGFEDMRELDSRGDVAVLCSRTTATDPVVSLLASDGLLRPGNVLVQDPYRPDAYVEVSQAAEAFALEKSMLFSRLCQLLGARQVSVETVTDLTSRVTTRVGALAGEDWLGADGSVEAGRSAAFRAELSFCDQFAGGSADIGAAERLLAVHRLRQDSALVALVDGRRILGNVQQRRQMSVDLSAETERSLGIAAGLEIPGFFGVGADLKRVVRSAAHYQIKYTVDFSNGE